MIRFIHTADIHFGVENYGKIDQKTGIHSRLLDFNKALNYCINFAIDKNVDFFVFAGDAYKTAHPSPTQQRLLLRSFLRLYKENIPVIIVVGNHDNPLSFGKAHAVALFDELPIDGFKVISKPTCLSLQTNSGPIQVVGIPWPTRNTIAITKEHLYKSSVQITDYIAKAVSSIIQDYAKKLDPTIPAILTGHLTVSSGIFSGSEKRAIFGNDPVLLPSQLAISPFDYIALGHLHRYQNLNSKGNPPLVYSGSIERIDFGERKEDKGFCYVTIEKKGTTIYDFIKAPMRPFVQIEAQVKPGPGQTDELIEVINNYDIKDAIVKILYHIPAGKKDQVDLRAITRACSQALDVVGIIPVRQPDVREHRVAMKVDMDLETLLYKYFDTKKQDEHNKKDLVDKALALELEIKEEQQQTQ